MSYDSNNKQEAELWKSQINEEVGGQGARFEVIKVSQVHTSLKALVVCPFPNSKRGVCLRCHSHRLSPSRSRYASISHGYHQMPNHSSTLLQYFRRCGSSLSLFSTGWFSFAWLLTARCKVSQHKYSFCSCRIRERSRFSWAAVWALLCSAATKGILPVPQAEILGRTRLVFEDCEAGKYELVRHAERIDLVNSLDTGVREFVCAEHISPISLPQLSVDIQLRLRLSRPLSTGAN